MNTDRRPSLSARRPASTSTAPNTIVYADTTHPSVVTGAAGNEVRRSANATFITDRFSPTTSALSAADHRTEARRPSSLMRRDPLCVAGEHVPARPGAAIGRTRRQPRTADTLGA